MTVNGAEMRKLRRREHGCWCEPHPLAPSAAGYGDRHDALHPGDDVVRGPDHGGIAQPDAIDVCVAGVDGGAAGRRGVGDAAVVATG